MLQRLTLAIALSSLNAHAATTASGVANAADFSTPVSPGSLATIFGTDLAPGVSSPAALPFPTSFNGVSVTVNGREAPLTYLSPTQINFQIPASTPPGNATAVVTNNGQRSAPVQLTVSATAPGIFQYGAGRGIVQNQDYKLNTATEPASTGSIVTVYLTGIGATVPLVADGTAAPSSPLAQPAGRAVATIGGSEATVQFIGLTPGAVGLAQANLSVPSMPSGDYPVAITLNGQTSRPALISVRSAANDIPAGLPSGSKCVSGQVDYVLFSQSARVSRLADEVSIGGVRLCEKCDLKPPLHGNFVTKIEAARLNGLMVDACYSRWGTMDYVRMRQ